jgi:hypothetical protein
MRLAVFNVLTPAQKTILTELHEKMERNHDDPPRAAG